MIAELADPCTYLGDIFDPADAKPYCSALTPIINLANQGITAARGAVTELQDCGTTRIRN